MRSEGALLHIPSYRKYDEGDGESVIPKIREDVRSGVAGSTGEDLTDQHVIVK